MEDVAGASSTPIDSTPISASDALTSFTPVERAEWRKTGALPESKISVPDAASPAAEPAVQVASPEVAEPASKPGIVPKKKNADSRVEELLAERAQLRRELELAQKPAPRTDEVKAASSTASTDVEPKPELDPATGKPFPDWDSFNKAQGRWAARQELAARETAQHQQFEQVRVQEAQHQRASAFSTQLIAAVAADPTFFTDKVSAEVQGLKPFAALAKGEPGGVDNAIAEELIDSPVAAQLMVHLSASPDDLAKLRACGSPRALARAVGQLEARFSSLKPAAQPLKTIPGAPAPPVTVGTRPASTADPVESAIQRRDQKAYNREMNARELAK